MRRIQLIAALFSILLPATLFSKTKPPEAAAKGPSPAVVKFLGQATIDVLKKAEKVEVFRVKFRGVDEKDAKRKTVGEFVITAEGKPQDKGFAERIAGVLLDEKTYDFDSAKGCIFQPGVGYRIWSGEKTVKVILCFQCDELVIFAPKAADGSVQKVMEDFDNARPALLKLAKEAFPDDKEIQELK